MGQDAVILVFVWHLTYYILGHTKPFPRILNSMVACVLESRGKEDTQGRTKQQKTLGTRERHSQTMNVAPIYLQSLSTQTFRNAILAHWLYPLLGVCSKTRCRYWTNKTSEHHVLHLKFWSNWVWDSLHTEFEVRRHCEPHGGSVSSVCNAYECMRTYTLWNTNKRQVNPEHCAFMQVFALNRCKGKSRGKWTEEKKPMCSIKMKREH